MSTQGERGPRGDHGQTGHIGETGDIGPIGETGETGETGERGRQGVEGKSTRISRNTTTSFAVLTLVFVVVLAGFVVVIVQNRDLARKGEEALAGLCALRHDIEVRRDGAVKFLRDNPKGIPGIPAATLRNSIRNQNATLKALDDLDCDP